MKRKRQLLAWIVTFVMVLTIIPNISISVFAADYDVRDAWDGKTFEFGDVIKDINYGCQITIQYGEFKITNPSTGSGYFKSYYSDSISDSTQTQGIKVLSPDQFAAASGKDVASWKPGFKIASWKVWRLMESGGDPTAIMLEPNWEKLEVGKPDVVAVPEDKKVTLNWNAAENATGYEVYSGADENTCTTQETVTVNTVSDGVYSCDVTNLENGNTYYFKVVALNSYNGNQTSADIVSAIPKGVPGAPTDVTAVAENSQAIISFNAPLDNGGSSINKYIITSNPGGITAEGTASPITVEGLTYGTPYTFTVKAVNAVGIGLEGSTTGFTTPKRPQSVDSITISGVTTSAAIFKVDYVSDDALLQQGFSYRKMGDSNWIQLSATVTGSGLTATVSGLASGTAYDVKGYILTTAGETQTQVVSFTTAKISTGGKRSAGGTSNTGSLTAQQVVASIYKAIEQGTTPTVAVDKYYKAQVPVEALEAIAKAGKDLVVQLESIDVSFNAQTVQTLLNNDNTGTPLQITAAPIAHTILEQIKQQLPQAQGTAILGGSELTLALSVNTTQQLDTFVEPLEIKLDLSKVDVKDVSKLTLVRYETQKDGSVTVVKLGGKYDEKSKSLSAKTNEPGLYGVMAVDSLTQIILTIDNNEIELNGNAYKNDVAPEIINDLTMMPLRTIAESLGATVEWDDTLKQAVVMLDGKRIVVGKEQGLLLKENKGRTLVPVRFISENLGANVLWIPSSRQVQIVR